MIRQQLNFGDLKSVINLGLLEVIRIDLKGRSGRGAEAGAVGDPKCGVLLQSAGPWLVLDVVRPRGRAGNRAGAQSPGCFSCLWSGARAHIILVISCCGTIHSTFSCLREQSLYCLWFFGPGIWAELSWAVFCSTWHLLGSFGKTFSSWLGWSRKGSLWCQDLGRAELQVWAQLGPWSAVFSLFLCDSSRLLPLHLVSPCGLFSRVTRFLMWQLWLLRERKSWDGGGRKCLILLKIGTKTDPVVVT